MLDQYLSTLAVPDPLKRRQALQEILNCSGLPYVIQKEEPGYNLPLGLENYLIPPLNNESSLLLCAHYDTYPGSIGANDNAAAVCILIQLTKTLREMGINIRTAFFDGEELKQAGSRLYVTRLDRSLITGVINLDLCGFGDSIVFSSRGNIKKTKLSAFTDKTFLKNAKATQLKYLPPSDDCAFHRICPTLSLAIVPYWDIQSLRALGTFGSGLFGQPPEFNMILEQMEVTTTMHGGYRDTLEAVDVEAMDKVYQFLLTTLRDGGYSRRR